MSLAEVSSSVLPQSRLDLSDVDGWSTTSVASCLPLHPVVSPNSALVALTGSHPAHPGLSLLPHPIFTYSEPRDSSYQSPKIADANFVPSASDGSTIVGVSPSSVERTRHLAVAFSLALHIGTDVSDIIRLALEGSNMVRRKEDLLGENPMRLHRAGELACW